MSMIINDKRQKYYGEIKARFYLRRPTASGPRKIYLIVYIDGKQYRYSTGVRVYPKQWNSKKELAVVSNTLSKQDNQNNMIANERLAKIRRYFAEFIEYLCENDVTDIVATLKQFIYQDVAKKNFDPYAAIMDALHHYHNYVKPSIKDSTKRQSESLLSEFARFVDSLPEKDKTMQIFSQSGLNMYKEYLIEKMNKSKVGATKRNFGVGQLNRCGAIIALLINKVFVPKEEVSSPVVWIKVEDPRREDQVGHIPLLDDEVTAIENCSGLSPVEEEYRNVFLLHLECGQRVSDLAKLLTGNYTVKQGKKYNYIVLSTMKENIKAIIPLTPRMTMLIERIKSQKLVDPVEFEEKTRGKGNNTYNEAIRRIAKKAGLDREIVKIDSTQKEVRKPLYKTVSSHDARCTFITNMIRKGVSPERLCRMTGHANDEMIKRVYAQLTVDDEINRIESDLYSDVEDDEV
jgi:integrase